MTPSFYSPGQNVIGTARGCVQVSSPLSPGLDTPCITASLGPPLDPPEWPPLIALFAEEPETTPSRICDENSRVDWIATFPDRRAIPALHFHDHYHGKHAAELLAAQGTLKYI
jgi:hypothetical protein